MIATHLPNELNMDHQKNQSATTFATQSALAAAQKLVKPQLREAGRMYFKRTNDCGKVKKVYKALKIVMEISESKEFDDDDQCQKSRPSTRRCQEINSEHDTRSTNSQGSQVSSTEEQCQYAGMPIEAFFKPTSECKQEFNTVYKKSYKVMKQASRKLYEHQLTRAGLFQFL